MFRRCLSRLSQTAVKDVKHMMRTIPYYESQGKLSPDSAAVIASLGCTSLFPIQAEVFDHIVSGRDTKIRSPTGTGKTISYILPLVSRLLLLDPAEAGRIHSLVISPTAELCVEIKEAMLTHSQQNLNIVLATKSRRMSEIEDDLQDEVDVLICTPGIARFLLTNNNLLDSLKIVVLDEADQHLDQAKRDASTHISVVMNTLAAIKHEFQWITVSAALPVLFNDTHTEILKNPVVVDMVSEGDTITNELIDHKTVSYDKRNKVPLIAVLCKKYLQKNPNDIIVVFVNYISETHIASKDRVWKALGLEPLVMNGKMTIAEREKTVSLLKRGHRSVVIATDVLSRGLNFPNLNFVINSGLPGCTSSYIYRCGRVSRQGNRGMCVSILSPGDDLTIKAIETDIHTKFTEANLSKTTLDLVRSFESDEQNTDRMSTFDTSFSAFSGTKNRFMSTTAVRAK